MTYNAHENQSNNDCRLANVPLLLTEGLILGCHCVPPKWIPHRDVSEPHAARLVILRGLRLYSACIRAMASDIVRHPLRWRCLAYLQVWNFAGSEVGEECEVEKSAKVTPTREARGFGFILNAIHKPGSRVLTSGPKLSVSLALVGYSETAPLPNRLLSRHLGSP